MTSASTDTVRQFTVAEDDAGVRVDRWFKRHLPQIGFGTVSRWARTGQLRVDGKRVRPEDRLDVADRDHCPCTLVRKAGGALTGFLTL